MASIAYFMMLQYAWIKSLSPSSPSPPLGVGRHFGAPIQLSALDGILVLWWYSLLTLKRLALSAFFVGMFIILCTSLGYINHDWSIVDLDQWKWRWSQSRFRPSIGLWIVYPLDDKHLSHYCHIQSLKEEL